MGKTTTKTVTTTTTTTTSEPFSKRGISTQIVPLSCYLLLFLVAVWIRWTVSLNSYSGQGTPPMFGDFEAQRHWMEITVHLPIRDWYRQTTDNDLQYWGLDYPPLTAYHSLANGVIARYINESWVALHRSRGLEEPSHKLFMRSTVLIADILVYLPAILWFYATTDVSTTTSSQNDGKSRAFSCLDGSGDSASISRVLSLSMSLLHPALLLVDHGHFQYNCLSLGLALWAALAARGRRFSLAAALFAAALNYKQMELYHAVPFFIFLLRRCLSLPSLSSKLFLFLRLGFVVVSVFFLSWVPFYSWAGLDGLRAVLDRVFPFGRGLFEDKVANVWCSLQPILRLKEANQSLVVQLCLLTTALSFVPDVFLLWRRPSPSNLLRSLASTSLSFFLFSYHVHEKSVLLATAPASLLLHRHPLLAGWFLALATPTLLPLLVKDGLLAPTLALSALFLLLFYASLTLRMEEPLILPKCLTLIITRRRLAFLSAFSVVGLTILCCFHLFLTPPSRLPDLFPYLIAVYSCAHFLGFKMAFLWEMWIEGDVEKKRK